MGHLPGDLESPLDPAARRDVGGRRGGGEPGQPGNPLGEPSSSIARRTAFTAPLPPESLGKVVSHGSIRVSNEVAIELARQVMEAGGAGEDEQWVPGGDP